MHGLVNRAIQSFVTDTYGPDRWRRVTEAAELGDFEFEAMLIYDDAVTEALLAAFCADLGRSRGEVLEDLGTYLVSHPSVEALRRLLRFGGDSYVDFLHSLDDLNDRARLAVPDLHLPALDLREEGAGRYTLACGPGMPGFGWVMMGILRAMADDYGALVLLEHHGPHADEGADDEADEVIAVTLIESAFAAGRAFDLGARAG
ncbi:MAG: heme NO-binding domain-containing protein [Antarcticimicrobium sp.]|uniref:heme NO-binding domain-containing protein n=1 Tax=Antarcticimicrobium sp. TaxID=2824147 RepID=UPI00261B5775|nr:heme NO-binding domain-containing protein [Antarcticimicrobium sp.]MDF1717020.1 heme NO-binding domain-containing protein [Antarcticimicrobium sp.]